jgi:exodeoxyribonuclease VII small subunit
MPDPSFEHALARLEQLVQELEQGAADLEGSLQRFEEGVQLVTFCNHKLQEAERRVDLLVSQNGSLSSVPLTGTEG